MTIIEGEERTAAIRDLNDDFRRSVFSRPHGRVLITSGVNAFGPGFAFEAMTQCARFDTFTESNDPHAEHDFGEFEVKARKLFWKIDYYDIDMEHGSDDPADPDKTTRVLTIMLADEY